METRVRVVPAIAEGAGNWDQGSAWLASLISMGSGGLAIVMEGPIDESGDIGGIGVMDSPLHGEGTRRRRGFAIAPGVARTPGAARIFRPLNGTATVRERQPRPR